MVGLDDGPEVGGVVERVGELVVGLAVGLGMVGTGVG